MKIIEKYTGTKTYMYPNGTIATVESVTENFPAWQNFTHIVETDEAGEVLFASQNLSATCSIYGIDCSLLESEKIKKIQEMVNAPTPIQQPSAEERIAAALEFQNLLSL